MEFDNATNLDRKSGVRGMKRRAKPFNRFLRDVGDTAPHFKLCPGQSSVLRLHR